MRRTKITFLGPVQWEGKWTAETPCHFFLLQTGGEMLKLEYVSRYAAADARADLLRNPRTHNVPSSKLLDAIRHGLQEASEQGQP